MSELYETIVRLCAEKGITITELCRQSGASRGSLTDLKMGRKSSLSTGTLSKIAAYFGVSIDYLIGNQLPWDRVAEDNERRGRIIEEIHKEKAAALKGDELDELVKDELVGFYGDVKKELTPGDIEDIKTLMKIRAELNRSKGK